VERGEGERESAANFSRRRSRRSGRSVFLSSRYRELIGRREVTAGCRCGRLRRSQPPSAGPRRIVGEKFSSDPTRSRCSMAEEIGKSWKRPITRFRSQEWRMRARFRPIMDRRATRGARTRSLEHSSTRAILRAMFEWSIGAASN